MLGWISKARRPEQSAAIVLIVTAVTAAVRFPHDTATDLAFCALALLLGFGGAWALLRFAKTRETA
ncbi:hypothetical protein [Aquabacter spiritensis]|uniref:Uncharacterized protein n=1 Tax=Aquabacter spiritensis TaxID=933073 RepID=A0A4R3M0N1_9HYPH|nr:hypothetical protein [Aquabacter spiritensis]TCT06631.1 hypothetical protein EDC64_102109 [Aquabacter spiritensis]